MQSVRLASAAAPSGAPVSSSSAAFCFAPMRIPSCSAASPAGVIAARRDRFGRSGRPAPVPVPGGSTSASPRAGVDTYSRATHSPSATSDCGTSASSAAIGSASRSGGRSLSAATSTTTPSSRLRPNGTTSMLPTPTSSSAPASR